MGKKKTFKRNRRYVRARAYRVNQDEKDSVATSDEGKNKKMRKKILENKLEGGTPTHNQL